MNSRIKAACLDEGQQEDEEDEEESVCSTFEQPKLTAISKFMQSLENVAAIIENKRCTSESTQVCHIRDMAAALI